MNKKNEIQFEKCAVCGQAVAVRNDRVNECQQCGWIVARQATGQPNVIAMPNFVSLNKARQLFQAGKPLEPDYDDFIQMIRYYGEVEFYYNFVRYGIATNLGDDGECYIELFIVDGEVVCKYLTLEEFATKANINGVLLKDLWPQVKNANWLQ